MEIAEIASVLEEEAPEYFILQSYDGGALLLAFVSDGGPNENEAYVVRFERTILFHLPARLYDQVRLRKSREKEREALIPEESYDPGEVGGGEGQYTVVLLTNQDGKAYGYYIAAESVSAEWVPMESLLVSI